MTKIKRRGLSVETKLEIIKAVEAGGKKANIGRQYGIPSSTLSTILKHRQSLISKFAASHFSPSRKRFRTAVRADLDEALGSWSRDRLAKNLLVNGPILKQRAQQLAEAMGYEDFQASSGWLMRFKERYQIGLTRKSRKKALCSPDLQADMPQSCTAGSHFVKAMGTGQNSSLDKESTLPQPKPTTENCQVGQGDAKIPSNLDFSAGPRPVPQLCLSDKSPVEASSRSEKRGSRPKTTMMDHQDEPVNILSRLLQELSRGTATERETVAQVQDKSQLPTTAAEKSRHKKDKASEYVTSSEADPGPSTQNCIDMMHSIKSYLRRRNNTPENIFSAADGVLEYLAFCKGRDEQNNAHQMKITDYYFTK